MLYGKFGLLQFNDSSMLNSNNKYKLSMKVRTLMVSAHCNLLH